MKRMKASDARREWFRLLDEVVAGEVIVVERKGRSVVLRCEQLQSTTAGANGPDYTTLLAAADIDDADRWGWEWEGPEGELRPVEADTDRSESQGS